MFFWFGTRGKIRRVPDGQFEKRRCPECDKTTVFRECVVDRSFVAYSVIKLWDSKSTVFACDACCATMKLADTLDPELSPRERALQEQLAAKQAAIAGKRQKLAALEIERREQAKVDRVEAELAAIKRRLEQGSAKK